MIKRAVNIKKMLRKGKALIIYGPRRAGKTTLLNEFISKSALKTKLDSGDNIRTQNLFSSLDFEKINEYVSGYELIAVDEAQQIKNIGKALKIIVDNNPDIYVIATGSSSFELSQKIGEPLTGRKTVIMLFPFWQKELLALFNRYELKEKLAEFLIFGSYPEVVLEKNKTSKKEMLMELVNSYLLKDVLALENIKGSQQILDLLKLLAFQTGNEVSYNELANAVKLDVKTVMRYIDLLEKGFVIYRLTPFSRNLRSEITKKSKYYFYDNGIRNGVILQFNDLSYRADVGQLFENFIISERRKFLAYNRIYKNVYFWRTYRNGEIDYLEEGDGELSAREIKWNANAKVKKPKKFFETYPNVNFDVINSENYLNFIL